MTGTNRKATARAGKLAAFLAASAAILVLAFQPWLPWADGAARPAAAGGSAKKAQGVAVHLEPLGFKFTGVESCAGVGANCHGAEEAKPEGTTQHNENFVWNNNDPHKLTFEQLGEQSADIAKAMKIENAAEDARCLACHAVNVKKNLMAGLTLEEGVSCEGCHGPAEKWKDPHKELGWTQKQRVANKTHDALLKKTGLYDTKSALARADICVSCHLAIDAELVKAGHPQPKFELGFYSQFANFATDELEAKNHWRDPPATEFATLWAVGQVVALRDAMNQVIARKGDKTSVQQAMAHYAMVKSLLASKAIAGAALPDAAAVLKGGAGAAGDAKKIADASAKLIPAANGFKGEKAKSVAILKSVLADKDVVKNGGQFGMQQQAFALYTLWTAAGANEETQGKILEEVVFPVMDEAPPAAEFSKKLAEVGKGVK